jgi:hypothetical protein
MGCNFLNVTLLHCFIYMRYFFVLLLLIVSFGLSAKTFQLTQYSINVDTLSVHQQTKLHVDSVVNSIINASVDPETARITFTPKPFFDKTFDFYLILTVALFLGCIKTIHPRFFTDVFRAFINPTLGNRQLKDLIRNANFANLLMNIFAIIVMGMLVYYGFVNNQKFNPHVVQAPKLLVISILVLSFLLLYFIKYTFVFLIGWVFRIEDITDQYNYNVFLVNKVLGVVCFPIVVAFAFLSTSYLHSLSVLSIVLIVFFFVNRYARSWSSFHKFFISNKFHFLLYLCAFEILPIAILLKLIFRYL